MKKMTKNKNDYKKKITSRYLFMLILLNYKEELVLYVEGTVQIQKCCP